MRIANFPLIPGANKLLSYISPSPLCYFTISISPYVVHVLIAGEGWRASRRPRCPSMTSRTLSTGAGYCPSPTTREKEEGQERGRRTRTNIRVALNV